MIKPYGFKKRSPAHDPNPGAVKPRIRVALRGHGSYITDDLDTALDSMRSEIEWLVEDGDPAAYLRISVVMMGDEAVERLPEFDGW